MGCIEGYLTHKKQFPPKIPQKDRTYGQMVVVRGGAVAQERGSPVLSGRDYSDNGLSLFLAPASADVQRAPSG